MTITRFITAIFLLFILAGIGLFSYSFNGLSKLKDQERLVGHSSEEFRLVEHLSDEISLLFNALDALLKESSSALPIVTHARKHLDSTLGHLAETEFYKENKHFLAIREDIQGMIQKADIASAEWSTEEEKKTAKEEYHKLANRVAISINALEKDAGQFADKQVELLGQQKKSMHTKLYGLLILYMLLFGGGLLLAAKMLVKPLEDIVNSADESMNLGSPFVIEDKAFIREHVTLTWIIRMLIENLEENVNSRTRQLQNKTEELQRSTSELEVKTAELEEQAQIREQLETQLAHSQKMETIGQLASMITHEVNTPIQFIMDNLYFIHAALPPLVEKLEEGEDKENGEKILGCVESGMTGVNRVIEIVRSMKNFAHGGTDMMHAALINDALDDTIIISTGQWKYAAKIEKDYDPDLPLVRCRISELNQVFLNLIVNAAHAIADKGGDHDGIITVSTRHIKEEDMVEISIKDNGCGIPEDIQKKVFEKFFTTKKIGVGTGQGLAVSVMVVEKHQGKIWLESKAGEGTTFFIRIPTNPQDTEGEEENGDKPAPEEGMIG